MRSILLLFISIVAVGMIACGANNPTSTPAPATPVAPPAPTPALATPTAATPKGSPAPTIFIPTRTPVVLTGDVMVVYEKSNCFTGIKDNLIIHQGGALELTQRDGTKRTAQVDQAQLVPLRNLLADPAYARLDDQYEQPGADQCYYTITSVNANGQSRSISTVDGANHPPILGQTIALLEQLRAQVK